MHVKHSGMLLPQKERVTIIVKPNKKKKEKKKGDPFLLIF
jgi:hypothetical protein